MNPAQIWWEQVGNSLRLLSDVTNCFRDCRSTVLHLPAKFPWRQYFATAVEKRRIPFSESRQFIMLDWDCNVDPGVQIMDDLCPMEVHAEYYPGMTRAAYLGSRGDILLCDSFVWVTGIHTKAQLCQWTEFVEQYEQAARNISKKAVFILEYDGQEAPPVSANQIRYTLENYDCRVFCLEAAALLNNTKLLAYQAELALSIGGNDPEFCYALLKEGERFMEHPVTVTDEVIAARRASDGRCFDATSEQQIIKAVWKAQLILFFPTLEQQRMTFVHKFRQQIDRHLPINGLHGSRITDPLDLEIGPLAHIISLPNVSIPSADCDIIHLCRTARNTLAHNKVLSWEHVQRISQM